MSRAPISALAKPSTLPIRSCTRVSCSGVMTPRASATATISTAAASRGSLRARKGARLCCSSAFSRRFRSRRLAKQLVDLLQAAAAGKPQEQPAHDPAQDNGDDWHGRLELVVLDATLAARAYPPLNGGARALASRRLRSPHQHPGRDGAERDCRDGGDRQACGP